MKSRITLMSLLSVMVVFAASAQETDDMYFRAGDRAKIAASRPLSELNPRISDVKTPINPTDSYSARNVNPEYISQSVNTASQQPATYFYSEYVPTSVNQNIYNNPANWNYYGMNNPYMMAGMNPYMVGGYNPYFRNSFWGMDPYGFNSFYRPGLSFSVGMGWGMSSWGYSPWNNFYGMNSWAWDPYGYNAFGPWGWNNMGWNGWGWNSWNRPTVIIVGGGDTGNGAVYGRRPSRSTTMNNTINSSRGTRQSAAVQNDTRGGSGSRMAAQNTESYYQRGWRNNPDNTTSRTSLNNTGLSTSRTGTTFDNSTRTSNRSSSWIDSGSTSRSSGSYSPGSTRSSGSNFSSGSSVGGSRSSGGGSSSGGSRGGRNN
ncbi:MAG: hypothetical protein KF856_02830 [Cyclobacteriaceae bacterium]|nr:hypothetical protein [Cyclobacteriaceae bacterium]